MQPRKPRQAAQDQPPTPPASSRTDLFLGGERVLGEYANDEALKRARQDPAGLVWVALSEPSEQTLIAVAQTFGLHPLAVEDAIHGNQRPKLEEYDHTSFLVIKPATYVEHDRLTATSEVVETGELMLFVGSHFLVSVQRGATCDLDRVRHRLDSDHSTLQHGAWAAVHAIMDTVVDEYLAVISAVSEDIARVEESIFSTRQSGDVLRIYKLNRETMELRRAVAPLTRPLALLSSKSPEAGEPDVPMALRQLFRDVADHQIQVVDQLNGYEQLLDSVISASLAEVGIRQNDDMRRISAWVALAAVPTMIAGIYGMNFDHMPELRWPWGYPTVIAVMATICGFLYRAFRRSGWL